MNHKHDPGFNQCRNVHHNPERDRDIVRALVLLLAPWLGAALLVWVLLSAAQW